jgi:hypothetical protein
MPAPRAHAETHDHQADDRVAYPAEGDAHADLGAYVGNRHRISH